MKIKQITTNDLRKMNGKEGLILQGCGGEVKDWVDGINEMLKKDGDIKEEIMYNTFNMGLGMIVAVNEEDVTDAKLEISHMVDGKQEVNCRARFIFEERKQ